MGKPLGYNKLMKVLIEYKMLLIQLHDNFLKLGKRQGTFSRFFNINQNIICINFLTLVSVSYFQKVSFSFGFVKEEE